MKELHKELHRQIIEKILNNEIKTHEDLNLEKRRISAKLHLKRFIRNSEILRYAKPDELDRLKLLIKKPVRTISGVAIVAVMTRPLPCPHGKCAYCPGGPEIGVPQSYTGKEPATRRAIQYGFDPYLQTTFRLTQLKQIGHPIDKVELIVMGGTLTAQCLDYQEWFVKNSLMAMNEFNENYDLIEREGTEKFLESYIPRKFNYLEDIQAKNENSSVRCVGMAFEPRPDWAKKSEIDQMLRFGVTRIEMGVQLPFDFAYKRVNRGHTVEDVVESTQQLKDSGLKVGYHMMPGLLGNHDVDLDGFKRIFEDERFKPDSIKIYPCLILKGTKYYELWKNKEFEPITTEEMINLMMEVKKMMPRWTRTMRIMRDIPSDIIDAGIKASNLGQIIYEQLKKENIRCKCIRCREVGHKLLKEGIKPKTEDIKLVREDYVASHGKEIFLSFDDVKNDILIGFLRLRIPYQPFRPEITDKTSLVRELHVYGPMVEIGETPDYEWQHRGYGSELLKEAEKISREEYDCKKILVTSGIGARNYYRKFGYERDGVYMSRSL